MATMIITIDGPAGVGKSSAAKGLAARLGFEFLNTGAMYRAVTLAGLRAGISLHDSALLIPLLDRLALEMPPGRVVLNGEDISGAIGAAEVSELASQVAANPIVRQRLVQMQRSIASGRNMVCEGRDQGTVVFPDAFCKFFLVADPAERARRRQRDLADRNVTVSLEEVLRDQAIRDQRDATRDVAPMVPAPDAVILDSTRLTLDEVVERMEQMVRELRMKHDD